MRKLPGQHSVKFLAIATLILLGACQAGQTPIGEGPVFVSPSVSNYYRDKYLQAGPDVFVLSADGRHASYSYCSSGNTGQECVGLAEFKALASCERRSGQKCFVFDRYGHIVWNGPVTFDASSRSHAELHSAHSGKRSPRVLCTLATVMENGVRKWSASSLKAVVDAKSEMTDRNITMQNCRTLYGG